MNPNDTMVLPQGTVTTVLLLRYKKMIFHNSVFLVPSLTNFCLFLYQWNNQYRSVQSYYDYEKICWILIFLTMPVWFTKLTQKWYFWVWDPLWAPLILPQLVISIWNWLEPTHSILNYCSNQFCPLWILDCKD